MNGDSKTGGRWLDALARWSVRGGDAGNERGPERQPDGPSSTTRRTALRNAVGAGTLAIVAPTQLLRPSRAGAASSALAECLAASNEAAYADYEKCSETPLENFLVAADHVDAARKALRHAKSAAERHRLEGVLRFQSRLRREALRDLGFCNKAFLSDRAEGDARCKKAKPPASGGTGGTGSGGNGGCEEGFLLCNDYCCNTSNAYCQGCNGKVVCCRIEADCCPSG